MSLDLSPDLCVFRFNLSNAQIIQLQCSHYCINISATGVIYAARAVVSGWWGYKGRVFKRWCITVYIATAGHAMGNIVLVKSISHRLDYWDFSLA
jgi:hypothetical protein